MSEADKIIAALNLAPHPEGGYFRETFRDDTGSGRAKSTAIYYLLKEGETSRWHRVDAAEIWHWYAGGPLELKMAPEKTAQGVRGPVAHILGNALSAGQNPQIVVPAHWWQSARPLGDWTLVGCTVAPGFEFDGFEMAPDGWTPATD